MLQETKVNRKGQIKIENYDTFEKVRNNREGGGIAIITHESLEAVLITEDDEEEEILAVQTNLRGLPVNLVTAYAPQETDNQEKRERFFTKLEEECQRAEAMGAGLILELDGNCKLGPYYLRGDKHQLTSNGKLFVNMTERTNLTIVNKTP